MKQYVVDAFTDELFSGNPAAVCILDRWPEDALLQNIARENNLSETAFAVKQGEVYKLRWMTPGGEIGLCGHAALGAAYVLMNFYETGASRRGGTLYCQVDGERIRLAGKAVLYSVAELRIRF